MGYEALSSDMLNQYFRYIRSKEDNLWVATFGDVTRYMREREAAKASWQQKGRKITVTLTDSLDKRMYYLPLTLKTYVPGAWKKVKQTQGNQGHLLEVKKDNKGSYVLYQATAGRSPITIAKL